jgi:hypothetical protein
VFLKLDIPKAKFKGLLFVQQMKEAKISESGSRSEVRKCR